MAARFKRGPRLARLEPNLVYLDVRVWTCPKCGLREVEPMDAVGLSRALALAIVRKGSALLPEEFRALRAECLGWNGQDVARYLGMSNVTVSRMEHGAQAITPAVDRALRLMAAVQFQFTPEEFSLEFLTVIAPKPDPTELLKLRWVRRGVWKVE